MLPKHPSLAEGGGSQGYGSSRDYLTRKVEAWKFTQSVYSSGLKRMMKLAHVGKPKWTTTVIKPVSLQNLSFWFITTKLSQTRTVNRMLYKIWLEIEEIDHGKNHYNNMGAEARSMATFESLEQAREFASTMQEIHRLLRSGLTPSQEIGE